MTHLDRPNIIVILADDMGFSDLGCFGSEIHTPNLDRLGGKGLRFTQMYTAARCCPSRASLLTGLHPHQAGIGHMVTDLGYPAYQGYLNDQCVTLAEALRADGYTTLMSGKWHVGGDYDLLDSATWKPGEAGYPTPRQRGFDRFYGIMSGAASYYYPRTLMRDDEFIEPPASGFYLTDEISAEAVEMVDLASQDDQPFFLYLSYTAPHWPLHAHDEDITRYEGHYRQGWDAIRSARHERLTALGLIDRRWQVPQDPAARPWSDAVDIDWEAARMAAYAAQIESMDRGIGRVLDTLARHGQEDNTLIIFLSDNGGCAEPIPSEKSKYSTPTGDGRPMRIGNIAGLRPGPADTFMSYDASWAHASNTPFRRFKRWVHEGGISTPCIVSWPDRISEPSIVHEPTHLVDIYASCLDAAGVHYPDEYNEHKTTPMAGESFTRVFDGKSWSREQPIIWEHEGNRAVRAGDWKLVAEHGAPWELYNIADDRTETRDLADHEPQRVTTMTTTYDEWAERCGVLPWTSLETKAPR
ncbi:arylsulfatase [Ruania alba]|uniref:Arylsulfatase n=1 Tax=Ruania alba TaxID=648782 RepID=A0A1H5HJ59_9MICO|nr:arylsulfatase [Ruania alba]SEE28023.1 arylsulfatase [Ruania alba]